VHAKRDPEASHNDRLLTWLAAWVIVWLAFYWPWASGAVTIPWDGKAHFAPQIQFMAASIARGEWPFWTPNVFAGHPQIADPQSMLFSAPFVVLALFDPAPGPWVIDSVIFVMLFVAGLFVMLSARDLGWPPGPGLIGAIVFCFGAAMAWRLQHFGQVLSLAYLPPTLFFLNRALTAEHLPARLIHGGLAGLIAAFIVLGRDQVGLLCLYLLVAFTLTRIVTGPGPSLISRLGRAVPPLAAGCIIAVSLITLPILFTLALASQSNRPEISFEGAGAGSLHPALLLTAIVPHLFGAAGEMANYWGPPSFTWKGTGLYLAQNMGLSYIGAVPFLLILSSLLGGDLWAREIRFVTIAWAVVLLYALGWYTPAFRWAYQFLPGVSFYRRPADAVFLIGAIAAFLATFAATRLLDEARLSATRPTARLAGASVVILALFALAIAIALTFDRLDQALPALGQAALWFVLAATAILAAIHFAPIRPLTAAACLVLPTAADIVWNNGPNGASALPSSSLAMLEPDGDQPTVARLKSLLADTRSQTRRDRLEMVGLGYHWPNTALTHNFDTTLGANPVRLDLYVRATGAGDTVALGEQRKFTPLFPSYRSPLANLLGLRFIASGTPIEEIDKSLRSPPLPITARTPDAIIYENKDALPRVLFATRAISARFADILATGRWPTTDFTTTVILENAPDTPATRRPGKIAITDYRNTLIKLSVDSPDGGFAVLNDVWHPWWRAEIDGKPADILRANVLFRAVEVPPGRHTVTFRFTPLRGLLSPSSERPKVRQPQPS
jgi:hypothetical protein